MSRPRHSRVPIEEREGDTGGRRGFGRSLPAREGAAADHERLVERARLAAAIDGDLQAACRAEALARRALGVVAREFLRRRAHRRLGFARVGDYAGERLGFSARALESAAWVATRLEELPAIDAAFQRGDLTWTQVRLLCGIAQPADELGWIARARGGTVDDLETLLAAERAARGVVAAPDPEDDLVDGEPPADLRTSCPARVRVLWRHTLELARRVAGATLAPWQAAEIIAAEGIAGRPPGVPIGDRVLLVSMRFARRLRRAAAAERRHLQDATVSVAPASHAVASRVGAGGYDAGSEATVSRPAASPRIASDATLAPLASCDTVALDARLRAATAAISGAEPRIGRLLRLLIDHRLYRLLGCESVESYVRNRLGFSLRKAWALLKIERVVHRLPELAEAYSSGRLSWVRALTLLAVVDRQTAGEWLARADAVTLRRLADEVNWVLDRRDTLGPDAPLAPPLLDAKLSSPVSPTTTVCGAATNGDGGCHETSPAPIVQLGALSLAPTEATRNVNGGCPALEVQDAEIRFTGPASVVALFRDALDAYAQAGEPRWTALERLLTRVSADWQAEARHRDPVFARDGWRCAVPGCSGRRNLHDHHLQFRSHGGGDERANRVTVCAAHHLHGIHAGVVRAWGRAPAAVHWELGVRSGAPPFLTYVGDRLTDVSR